MMVRARRGMTSASTTIIFRLYALDVPQLALPERFTGQQAHAALYGHILDEAQLVVAYSLNPELALTLKK